MVTLIETLTRELAVQPTDEKARTGPLPGIKAILFDVYGTLLISGSGDTGLEEDEATAEQAMVDALHAEGIVTTPTMELAKGRRRLIRDEHARARAAGTEHPEVEIRDIWKLLLAESRFQLSPETAERVIMRHECAVNPVWPMPGAIQLLAALRLRGMTMGIVSNAQFYTLSLLEYLFDGPLPGLGFREDLCLWSFEEREAKPSTALFAKLGQQLANGGVRPEEILYIGNDMRNDIAPAVSQGFKTALFAGDARSLRWREEDGLAVEPDLVLTDLGQLQACLP